MYSIKLDCYIWWHSLHCTHWDKTRYCSGYTLWRRLPSSYQCCVSGWQGMESTWTMCPEWVLEWEWEGVRVCTLKSKRVSVYMNEHVCKTLLFMERCLICVHSELTTCSLTHYRYHILQLSFYKYCSHRSSYTSRYGDATSGYYTTGDRCNTDSEEKETHPHSTVWQGVQSTDLWWSGWLC